MPHDPFILKTHDLSIGYPGKQIAHNLNLNFQREKLHALIGINGIGKSTLLKTLAAQLKPHSGTIELNQKELNLFSTRELAREVGIVFTHRNFSQNLTVFDFVALGRHPYTGFIGKLSTIDKEKIAQAIKTLQIQDLSRQNIVNLSDGQLQKVLIARVLAQDTSLILMDEPTHHLDFYNRAFVMRLLKKLTRDFGKTVLFSTHEINMALQLSDEIVLLQDSGCSQQSPEKLMAGPILDNLFPKDEVKFDKKKESFKIKDL